MNKTQEHALRLLRYRTRFTSARVGRPGLWGIDNQGEGFTAAFRFASRIFRRSWIEPLLDALESEETTKRLYQLADDAAGDRIDTPERPATGSEFGAMAEHILKPTIPDRLEFRAAEIEGTDLDDLEADLALRGLTLERLDQDVAGYAIRITRAE
jgi:hypothetical protein